MILEALRIERELVQVMLSVLSDGHTSEFEKVTVAGEHARAIQRTDVAIAKIRNQELFAKKLLKELRNDR